MLITEEILVSVHIVTYNQVNYIREAIDSVLTQKVNFNFEIVIGDDNSTDGTQNILREYAASHPEKFNLQLSDTNRGFVKNWIRVFNHCKGKYIAVLEGDDYWTNENKLQKQVDFLEANPDYGLACSDYDRLYVSKNKVIKNFCQTMWGGLPSGDIFNRLIYPQNVLIQFLTTVFRKELAEKYYDLNIPIQRQWQTIDVGLWIVLSRYSKVKYFPESMAVYRVLKSSISNSSDQIKRYLFNLKVYDIYFYFARQYKVSDEINLKIRQKFYRVILHNAFFLRKKRMAKKCMLELNKSELSLSEKTKYFMTRCPVLNRTGILLSRVYNSLK